MAQIKKVLIANRGEIAVRIIRTLKEMNIPSVLIYHAEDHYSQGRREADESIEIFGDTPVAAYINPDNIIAACRKSGANAVHPGYGFLSENSAFVQRLEEEEIIFIGPSADIIKLMGDKISARSFMIKHDFPIVPSVVEEEDPSSFAQRAKEIGVPLLIKAAAGGGGKGMRIVRDAAELESQIEQARSEGLRYFGDGRLFCERYIERPRHIEVQILADQQGNVVHLWERECSIQRRFQKVVEEAPSPTLNDEQRQKICQTAVDMATKAGYSNAGTVEFILAQDGTFYFLEMNTRIQVEHPVTEFITGMDLIAEQIRVANGESLTKTQDQIQINGHAIECRINAEDPDQNFMPSLGTIHKLKAAQGAGMRFDTGLRQGQAVGSAFDPMLGKLITHGSDREQARNRALRGLQETILMGLTSNISYLQRILNLPEFVESDLHTHFLEEFAEQLEPEEINQDTLKMLLAIAVSMDPQQQSGGADIPEPYASIGAWRN